MTIDELKSRIVAAIDGYPVKKIVLFGSRAAQTNRADSDVDLIIEFSQPVSLLMLSALKIHLENAVGLNVDIVHGPLQKDDLLEIGAEVELYAA